MTKGAGASWAHPVVGGQALRCGPEWTSVPLGTAAATWQVVGTQQRGFRPWGFRAAGRSPPSPLPPMGLWGFQVGPKTRPPPPVPKGPLLYLKRRLATLLLLTRMRSNTVGRYGTAYRSI